LEWVGEEIPPAETVSELPVKNWKGPGPPKHSQFMFAEPRKKQDQARVRRLGMVSTPEQKPGNFLVLTWPHLDRLLEKVFGIK
jgi:hypothetical protein